MMRDQIVACLVACLLVASAGMAVTAQDETPDAQRVELPDAGIAITFPAGWDVEARSEPGEYQLPLEFADQSTLEIATVPYWKVLWASDPGSGMNFCSVDMYEEMPMSPARHAEQTVRRLSEVDPESVATPVRLSAGDAVRVDTEWGGAVRANYYLDVDGQRFSLHCTAGTRPQDDWLSIAETIEITRYRTTRPARAGRDRGTHGRAPTRRDRRHDDRAVVPV